jgi:RNA polymerase sigma-70 factor (ECF subfamily)
MNGDARTGDAALAARIAAGDLTAFEEVYRVHASRLYNLAWRMLGNAADAEDALQEAFLQAFRKIGSFKADAALGTWLYRLAMNLCLDRLRSRTTRDGRHTESLDGHPAPHRVAVAPREMTATRLELERAIGRLPEGARAAFVLHDVEGFDHREVGAILGVSEGTSKSQVHKARMKLREWLTA